MIKKSDRVKVREAVAEDGLAICLLLNGLGMQVPCETENAWNHWRHLWDENPYYKLFKEKVHYGWVLEDEGRVVGFFGKIPRIYYLDGKIISAFAGTQWGIEPTYRRYVGKICDQYFGDMARPLTISTSSIKNAGRIFLKYQGKANPDKNLGKIYMVPLNLFKILAVVGNKKFVKSICGFLGKIVPWRLQYLIKTRNVNVSILDLSHTPRDFDRVMDDLCKNTTGLMALRSTAILRWLSSSKSERSPNEFFVYTENGETRGYASISHEGMESYPHLKRFKVTDLLAENSKVKKALLGEIIRHSCKNRADILEMHSPSLLEKKDIPSVWILQREYKDFPFFYHTNDKGLAQILSLEKNWNISPFDGDSSS